MVDILDVSSGRIVLRDAADGHTVFDTDERLFTVTDRVSGAIELHSHAARNNNGNDTHNIDGGSFSAGVADYDFLHTLAAVNQDADTVRGAFSVTTNGGAQGGLTNLGYFNASGTYVHYLDGVSWLGSAGSKIFVRQIAAYTFKCYGGSLYLRERVWLGANLSQDPGLTITVTLLAPTFTYNLFAGVWI